MGHGNGVYTAGNITSLNVTSFSPSQCFFLEAPLLTFLCLQNTP